MGVSPMVYWSISSIVLTQEAEKLGLKVDIISKSKNLFYIQGNGKKILFKSTDCGLNSSLGIKIADDKELTYKILDKYQLPTATSWYMCENELNTLKDLPIIFPVIIKPLEEGHGNGVMMNISDFEELKDKLEQSYKIYSKMIIQRQIEGKEYRVIVFQGEVIITFNRDPASIIGDGKNTINKLIAIENKNPLRGDGYNSPLSFIKTDSELKKKLQIQGLTVESIPKNNEKIYLRSNSNIGTGGVHVDATSKISRDVKNICISATEALGLNLSCIDIITTDITKPLAETKGIILEVGGTPGIGGHEECTGINTGKIILEKLFF